MKYNLELLKADIMDELTKIVRFLGNLEQIER